MSSPDVLLNALRVITSTAVANEHLRDQIMGHLHQQGVSLRTIASYTDMNHSTVANKCQALGDNLEDLETLLPTGRHLYPASEIIHSAPEQVINCIMRNHRDLEPVSLEELKQVRLCMHGLRTIPPELAPPASIWMVEEAENLFNHCLEHQVSVRPEEIASVYRRAIMSRQWRIEILGADALAPVRKRTMNILGRLTVEANRRER